MMKNIFTNKKMIIVSILAISLLAVLSFFVVKGITGTMNKVMVPPPTFIRAGTIKTLIENNDKYFLKIENFTEDGEYASPATEKQLTYKEYALIRANKDYDIFEVRKEGTIKSRYLSYLNRTTKDNQELLGNYLAEIIDGTFTPIKFVDPKEQRTILIDDDGTYYVATKFLDENGDYTQPAIYMMVDAETYNEHILSKKFDYQMVTEYRSEGNATLIITSFYDPNGEMIKRPIILHLTGFTNIEDYIRTVAPELLPSDEDKDTGDKGEDKTPGEGGGKGGSGDSGSGSDSGSGVQEPQAPWTGSDFTWYDIWDLMGDAATTWNDEYWNGETSESAWSDDFFNDYGQGSESELEYGYIDDNGRFIRTDEAGNVIPSEPGKFDEAGNFKPEGSDGYYDTEGIKHPDLEKDTGGKYDEKGNFYPEGQDGYFDSEGTWHPGTGESGGKAGHYDSEGNFILDDGSGYYDKEGVFHPSTGKDTKVIDEQGRTVSHVKGALTIDREGNIVVVGEEGYYDEKGLVHLPDGRVGYYDENGTFIESRTNPYAAEGGFYDKSGKFHSFNEVYEDSNKSLQVVNAPEIGLTASGDKLFIAGEEGYFDEKGLVHLPDGRVGYYDEHGNFIESTVNPYKGGFYDSQGNWIDDSLYSKTADGKLQVNQGMFDNKGNYITPVGDIGHFDETGKFIPYEMNPYKGGYYDQHGQFHEFGDAYIDQFGYVRVTGEDEYIDKHGNVIKVGSEMGIKDEKGNIVLTDGTVITPEGKVGYYNEKGKFVQGKNPYSGGYYDAQGNFIKSDGTVVTPDGKIGYYNAEGKFVEGTKPYEGGYYDAQGNFITESGAIIAKGGKVIMPDGTSVEGRIDAKGNIILTDGTVITPEGKVGYYDKEGKFVEGFNPSKTSYYDEHGQLHTKESKYYDEEGNIIEGVNPDTGGFYDSKGNYYMTGDSGYFDKQGTYHTADGKIGYYDEKGQFHEGTNPYQGGFYDKEGKWHGEGEAGKLGYYDSEGQWHEGTSPYEGGYYDKYGNWHPSGKNEYVDKYGNIHKQGDNAIGYIDTEGNFRMKGQDGYYDKEGNYHSPDGKIGYYDKEGKFHEGINPYEGGFYDAQGNWHPEGDKGYYDKSGKYHPSVSDEQIGYYDKDGKWNEGTSPYKGGYYDEKGNWHPFDDEGYYDKEGNYHSPDGKVGYFDKEGKFHEGKNPNKEGYYDKEGNFITFKEGQKKGYYDKSGNWHEGVSPYKDGFYDQHGNWHPKGADGYYDKTGTFRTKDGKVGYYDKYGNFHEGTNPYKTGYYDAEENFHPFDEDGYFDSEGTWHSADGEYGYYDEKGQFHKGKTNPYKGGYYDKYGNWHPFDEEGYYDSAGNFHLLYEQDDRYRVGSDNYILNEGYFRNPTDKRAYRKAGNTVQFTINGSDFTPRYIDTGIYVGQNAILQYDEIQDILHNIALQTGNVFVKDNYSCMLIYKGRVIKFNKADLISIREIREKFLDTDIIVKVAKSRIGGKYNFAEAVETKQDINFVYDGKPFTISNPLTVRDNEVLVPLNDFIQFFVYRTQVKEKSGEIIFTLDKGKVKQMQDIATSLRITVDDVNAAQEINGETKQIELKTPPIRIEVVKGEEKQIYIPVKLLPILTGKDVIWDANTFTLTFREKSNIILNTDMPEASIVSNATYKERTRYSD